HDALRISLHEEGLLEVTGAPSLHGEAGYSILERVGYRPTLDVNGIWGGFPGDGRTTIHPRPGPRQDQLPPRAGPGSRGPVRAAQGVRAGGRAARRDRRRQEPRER